MRKIIFHTPPAGTPILAVFYHIKREKEITEATGLYPYGYIIEEEDLLTLITEEDVFKIYRR